MARRKQRGREEVRGQPAAGWERLAGAQVVLAAFASQTVVVVQAESPFRLSKWAVAGGLAFVGAAVALAGAAAAHRLRLPVSRLLVVAAVLPVVMALSAAWSDAPGGSLRAAGWAGAMALVALAAAALDEGWRRRAGWAVVWGAEISAGVALAQAAGLDPLGIAPVAPGARFHITGLAGNPADLAAGSLLALAILSWLLAGCEGPARRRWLLGVPLLGAAAATMTLTALAALGALLPVLGLRLVPRGRRVRAAVAAGVLLAGALAVSLPRLEEAFGRVRSGDWYLLLSARGDGWSAAAEMIRERPLTGVGAGRYSCRFAPARLSWLEAHGGTGARGEMATHFEWAHCDPLQLAAELGVLGLAWLAGLAWAVAAPQVRRHPAWLPSLVAVVPFALLHYPFHLALTLVPLALLAGEMGARESGDRGRALDGFRRWAVVVPAGAVLAWAAWAGVSRLDMNLWLGRAEAALAAARGVPATARSAALLPVEREALERIRGGAGDRARLWRIVGRCRLGRGVPHEAEAAFRRSLELCAHEEAWMGVGLALAAQGRRGEGLVWLVRACRINPALARVIPEGSLREAVREAMGMREPRGGDGGGVPPAAGSGRRKP